MLNRLRELGTQLLPLRLRRQIVRFTRWPPVGWVRFGNLGRLRPISAHWGSERGQPVDRYYILRFLAANASDVKGHVLEIGTNAYTRRFGGERVTRSDVLHVAEKRPEVTIIGDLTSADHISDDTFDCIILTQTLSFIFNVATAVKTVYRILKPGGVALVTIPGITKISREDMDRWGHYWSFTTKSTEYLFYACFPSELVRIQAHGNVLAAVAFLHGLAAEDLRAKQLDFVDPDFQVLITIRAVKPEESI